MRSGISEAGTWEVLVKKKKIHHFPDKTSRGKSQIKLDFSLITVGNPCTCKSFISLTLCPIDEALMNKFPSTSSLLTSSGSGTERVAAFMTGQPASA